MGNVGECYVRFFSRPFPARFFARRYNSNSNNNNKSMIIQRRR
jgi:hypothetical protein